MSRNVQLNVASILMIVAAIIMIVLGVSHHALPPSVTGIGFFITAWGFQAAKR